MSDRIEEYLDGRLDRAALTPEEAAEAAAVEHVVDEARALLAAHPPPDLTASVMSRIEQTARPAVRSSRLLRLLWGLWAPREIAVRFRPVYGVLAAGIIVTAALLLPAGGQQPASDTSALAAARQPQLFVQFRLDAAEASDVRLAGPFTNWQPLYELQETAPGVWTVTVPLAAGVHDYVFLVNGERWVFDPHAQHVSDGFGGTNSRIALLAPEDPRS